MCSFLPPPLPNKVIRWVRLTRRCSSPGPFLARQGVCPPPRSVPPGRANEAPTPLFRSDVAFSPPPVEDHAHWFCPPSFFLAARVRFSGRRPWTRLPPLSPCVGLPLPASGQGPACVIHFSTSSLRWSVSRRPCSFSPSHNDNVSLLTPAPPFKEPCVLLPSRSFLLERPLFSPSTPTPVSLASSLDRVPERPL